MLVRLARYAELSPLEDAFRYGCEFVPTAVPKCSRITAADPKPAAVATCSVTRSVVSSKRCARRRLRLNRTRFDTARAAT